MSSIEPPEQSSPPKLTFGELRKSYILTFRINLIIVIAELSLSTFFYFTGDVQIAGIGFMISALWLVFVARDRRNILTINDHIAVNSADETIYDYWKKNRNKD